LLLHQHSQISELPCTEWTEYRPMTHWKRTTECNNNNNAITIIVPTYRQAIETICERLPQLNVVPSLALIIETIDSNHRTDKVNTIQSVFVDIFTQTVSRVTASWIYTCTVSHCHHALHSYSHSVNPLMPTVAILVQL